MRRKPRKHAHYEVEYRAFPNHSGKMEVSIVTLLPPARAFACLAERIEDAVRQGAEAAWKAKRKPRRITLLRNDCDELQLQAAGERESEWAATFILDMEPLTASKFLMRGKIWVDAAILQW